MDLTWDCVVVGGGAAGLSAALVLGRARQRTLLVDAGQPSNLAAHGIGGLLGHDGRPPAELYRRGRAELSAYASVEVRDGQVVKAEPLAERGFAVTMAGGSAEATLAIVLASGMDYRLPDIAGLAARWGVSVFHCPFCHGWEVRDRVLGVLDSDPVTGVHRALLLRLWSDDVTLYTNGPAQLSDNDRDRLAAVGVGIDERQVGAVEGPGQELEAISLVDGAERTCHGLLAAVVLHQRSPLAAQLGLALAEPSPIAADAVATGLMGATNLTGVFVAGDASAGMPSVANAVAAGSNAAAGVVQYLMELSHQPTGA